ncbi:MAG: YrhA family protein [Alphaproteobacteria bacterium]|nr:YrhA family protein [Alphaproteobacteria bacterium]MBO4644079.1 YrhA family protein [Alphaproteobacteria bacterium]
MIEDILKKLEDDDGAMIPRPASSKDLALCQKDMAETELPPVPQGYIDFLRGVNGFAWNGIEFYSTDQVTDPETNYTLNDIVSANEAFADYSDDFKDMVLLGRADEDLFVYNIANKKYEVLDFTAHDVMEDFDTFDAMFVGVVSPRL